MIDTYHHNESPPSLARNRNQEVFPLGISAFLLTSAPKCQQRDPHRGDSLHRIHPCTNSGSVGRNFRREFTHRSHNVRSSSDLVEFPNRFDTDAAGRFFECLYHSADFVRHCTASPPFGVVPSSLICGQLGIIMIKHVRRGSDPVSRRLFMGYYAFLISYVLVGRWGSWKRRRANPQRNWDWGGPKQEKYLERCAAALVLRRYPNDMPFRLLAPATIAALQQ